MEIRGIVFDLQSGDIDGRLRQREEPSGLDRGSLRESRF
jgi:hypothetical protein